MLRAFAIKLVQAAVTLLAIMTLSFFVVEMAPGGPLSNEHRVPASVRAAQYVHLGIGHPVLARRACKVTKIIPEKSVVTTGKPVVFCDHSPALLAPTDGKILALAIKPGETVHRGQLIAAMARPIWSRYLNMLIHMVVFDFGPSYESAGLRTVRQIIADAAPITALIGLTALVLALLMGFITGMSALIRPRFAAAMDTVTTFTLAVPMVVAAPAALYVCAVLTHCLPVGWDGTVSGAILPVFSLAVVYWAVFHRITARSTRLFMDSPYFTSLTARGLHPRFMFLHTLRHAALGVAGMLGPIAAALLTGSVVVEEVFHIPGLARFFVNSALGRDFPVLMGTVYFYALLLVTLNMGTDMLVLVLDPRTRRPS